MSKKADGKPNIYAATKERADFQLTESHGYYHDCATRKISCCSFCNGFIFNQLIFFLKFCVCDKWNLNFASLKYALIKLSQTIRSGAQFFDNLYSYSRETRAKAISRSPNEYSNSDLRAINTLAKMSKWIIIFINLVCIEEKSERERVQARRWCTWRGIFKSSVYSIIESKTESTQFEFMLRFY